MKNKKTYEIGIIKIKYRCAGLKKLKIKMYKNTVDK